MSNKSKTKLFILFILILIIIIAVTIILNIKKPSSNIIVEEFDTIYEDGVKVNTSEELSKPKILDGIEINNIRLSCRNGLSTLLADITNTSNIPIDELTLNVEILDKEENVIMELTNQVYSINSGETKELNINVLGDIAGAYNFRISK